MNIKYRSVLVTTRINQSYAVHSNYPFAESGHLSDTTMCVRNGSSRSHPGPFDVRTWYCPQHYMRPVSCGQGVIIALAILSTAASRVTTATASALHRRPQLIVGRFTQHMAFAGKVHTRRHMPILQQTYDIVPHRLTLFLFGNTFLISR